MADDKPTLDSVIEKVEAVLRLRASVRNAHDTVARISRELATYKLELSGHEAALAEIMGAKRRPRKWEATETVNVANKRMPYPKAKSGATVWMGSRKELGILQNDGRVSNSTGIWKCSKKDLWYPYPGESLSAIATLSLHREAANISTSGGG